MAARTRPSRACSGNSKALDVTTSLLRPVLVAAATMASAERGKTEVERFVGRRPPSVEMTTFRPWKASVRTSAPERVAARSSGAVPVLRELEVFAVPTWIVAHRELRTSRRIRLVFDRLVEALSEE